MKVKYLFQLLSQTPLSKDYSMLVFRDEIEEIKEELEIAKEVDLMFKKKVLEKFLIPFINGKENEKLFKKVQVTGDDFKDNEKIKNWISEKYYNDYFSSEDDDYFNGGVKGGNIIDLGNRQGSLLTYSVLKTEMNTLKFKGRTYLKFSYRFNDDKDVLLLMLKQDLKCMAEKEIDEGTTDIHLADMGPK